MGGLPISLFFFFPFSISAAQRIVSVLIRIISLMIRCVCVSRSRPFGYGRKTRFADPPIAI